MRNKCLKRLSEAPKEERLDIIESIKIQNYGLGLLSETDMWILTTAAENSEYLEAKLKEANELKIDKEAPSEMEDDLSLDEPSEDDDLSLDSGTEDDDLSLDEPSEDDDLSLDEPIEDDDLSLDEPSEDDDLSLDEPSEEGKQKIETSVEGAGILPLLAEIQEKLANGKPSEMELAALKAMKKMF